MTDTPITDAERLAQRLESVGWRPSGERDEAAALLRAQAAEIERMRRECCEAMQDLLGGSAWRGP